MATLLQNGMDCPTKHMALAGRAYGVIQGEGEGIDPAETAQEALVRLNDAIEADIERKIRRQHAREVKAAIVYEEFVTKN